MDQYEDESPTIPDLEADEEGNLQKPPGPVEAFFTAMTGGPGGGGFFFFDCRPPPPPVGCKGNEEKKAAEEKDQRTRGATREVFSLPPLFSLSLFPSISVSTEQRIKYF